MKRVNLIEDQAVWLAPSLGPGEKVVAAARAWTAFINKSWHGLFAERKRATLTITNRRVLVSTKKARGKRQELVFQSEITNSPLIVARSLPVFQFQFATDDSRTLIVEFFPPDRKLARNLLSRMEHQPLQNMDFSGAGGGRTATAEDLIAVLNTLSDQRNPSDPNIPIASAAQWARTVSEVSPGPNEELVVDAIHRLAQLDVTNSFEVTMFRSYLPEWLGRLDRG